MEDSLLELLTIRATTEADRIAVISDRESISYRELITRSSRLAREMFGSSFSAGDRGSLSPLHPQVPLSVTAEISSSFVELWWAAILARVPLLLHHTGDPPARLARYQATAGIGGALSYEGEGGTSGGKWHLQPIEQPSQTLPSRASALIATSGSSGEPKIIAIPSTHLFASAMRVNDRLSVSHDSAWLLSLFPCHIGGLSIIVRAMVAGCALVIPDDLKRSTIHRAAITHQVTHLSLVPSVVEEFLAVGPMPTSVRVLLLGGERIPTTKRAMLASIPQCVVSYGATETSSCIISARLVDLAETAPDAVGTPLANTTIRIIDEQGQEVPPGEIGTLEVHGPTIIEKSDRDVSRAVGGATSPAGDSSDYGTWRSSDLGFVDSHGCLHVIGRCDDVIISGGVNIRGSEVADTALSSGLVEEAYVVKAPDPRWGEQPILFVSGLKGSLATLSDVLRGSLGAHRTPRHIEVVESLPRTAIGKIDREALLKNLHK